MESLKCLVTTSAWGSWSFRFASLIAIFLLWRRQKENIQYLPIFILSHCTACALILFSFCSFIPTAGKQWSLFHIPFKSMRVLTSASVSCVYQALGEGSGSPPIKVLFVSMSVKRIKPISAWPVPYYKGIT